MIPFREGKRGPRVAPTDADILAAWSEGKSTNDMARLWFWPESDIANRLPAILRRERDEEQWQTPRA